MKRGVDTLEWSNDPLERLTELKQQREMIGILIAEAVGECRAGEEAWARIGEALGMTRQTVWERYRYLTS